MKNTRCGALTAAILGAFGTATAFAELRLEDPAKPSHAQPAHQSTKPQPALNGAPERAKALDQLLWQNAGWSDRIAIAGRIEIDAYQIVPHNGRTESNLDLATAELGMTWRANDWIGAEASLLSEQPHTDPEIDQAFITIHNPDRSPVFLTAGQFYVPFGVYDTNLISDPLTLEIGESRETAVQLGLMGRRWHGSLYAFKGSNQIDDQHCIPGWGANLGSTWESDAHTLSLSTGFINDIGDSNTLRDGIAKNRQAVYDQLIQGNNPRAPWFSAEPTRPTPGWTANLNLEVIDFNVIAEYVSAAGRFEQDSLAYRDSGAQPSAWNLELGYSFPVLGRDSVAALSCQGTNQATNLELPQRSWLAGWSVQVLNHTALALEYRYDDGAEDNASAVIAQLAVEF